MQSSDSFIVVAINISSKSLQRFKRSIKNSINGLPPKSFITFPGNLVELNLAWRIPTTFFLLLIWSL